MPEPRAKPFSRTVPEVDCPDCSQRMQLTGSETKPDTIQFNYRCEACGAVTVKLMPIPEQ
jgi:DNA-directed RNA polymerase subunit RPC12/RpoP